jgi:hypothetical protein
LPTFLTTRTKIVLLSAIGFLDCDIAEVLILHKNGVAKWRKRFLALGIEGLLDAPRSGRLRKFGSDCQDGGKRKQFYQKRVEMVAEDHHTSIDGTLKQDTSTVNDLSAFSCKARVEGCQEISVLYASDIELMDPICAQIFPGSSIGASSYPAFIRNNNIRKGIIVADKGFPSEQDRRLAEGKARVALLDANQAKRQAYRRKLDARIRGSPRRDNRQANSLQEMPHRMRQVPILLQGCQERSRGRGWISGKR